MYQLIPNEQYTEAAMNADGAFDALMRAALEHVQQEYTAGRIKGAEYAQVYLGAITAAFSNSTQFLLGQLNADKQRELIDAQIAKTEKESEAIDATVALTNAQITKIQAELSKIGAETTLLVKQLDKVDAEITVLEQRKLTEEAQILDVVNGNTVAGVIGKQKTLYQAQTDGFARDAEHKMAKLMADVWSVQRTTDEGVNTAGTGMTDPEIAAVINKARAGIGA